MVPQSHTWLTLFQWGGGGTWPVWMLCNRQTIDSVLVRYWLVWFLGDASATEFLLAQGLARTRLRVPDHHHFLLYHYTPQSPHLSAVSILCKMLECMSPRDDLFEVCGRVNQSLLIELSSSNATLDYLPILESTLTKSLCIGKEFLERSDSETDGASATKIRRLERRST